MYDEKMTVSTFLANILAKISVVILFGAGIYFYFIFRTFDMFPILWSLYAFGGIIVLVILAGVFCFTPKMPKALKIISLFFNIVISAAFIYIAIYLPSIRSQIEKMFVEIPYVGEAEINYYVLKDKYKVQPTGNAISTNFYDYENATFIIQQSTDLENQEYAMLVSNRELYSNGVNTVVAESIFDAVDMLYAGTGDVLVLNSSYIPIIEDVTAYEDFSKRVEVVYTVHKKMQISDSNVNVDVTNKPFTVMLVGNDKWGDDITTTGRTDVNLLLTIHPLTKPVSVVSIPRDAFVPNACLYNKNDKLTHAGIYGIQCTEQTIENYLGVEIDYYVVLNFSSMVNIVNALGGIDVNNPYAFTTSEANSYQGTFEEGFIHLNGEEALGYVRERKSLNSGDFGRGEHQNLVVQALIQKMTEPSIITKIDKVLSSMENTFKTNVTIEDIYSLAQMQLDDMAVWNVVSYALNGTTGEEIVASLDENNMYSVVYISEEQIAFVQQLIQQIVNGEVVEQELLPN